MAFIDDVNLIVHCNKVDLAIQAAENALREHGLPLNTQKTIIIKGSHPTVNYSGAKPTCSTAKIVGIPVGHSADGRKAILDKTKGRVQRELDALRKANVGLYIKFNLLRSCINAIPGYLIRVCEPTKDLIDFANSIDQMVDDFLHWLLGAPLSIQEKQRFEILRELPQRLGGLGIGRHSGWHGEKACLLSRHLTRQHVWKHFAASAGLEESLSRWRMLRLDHILDHLREHDTSIGSWWDKECNWVIDPNPDLPLNVRLQNRVEFEEQEKEYGKELREAMQSLYSEGQKLVMQRLEEEDRQDWQAWFLSSDFRGSGRFLLGEGEHLFGEFKFTKNDAYRMALRLRCLVDSNLPATSGPCPLCTRHLAERDRALHLLNCDNAQWFYKQRHDAVCRQVSRFMTSFGIEHQMEVDLGTGVPDEGPREGETDVSDVNTAAESRKRVADILYYPAGGDLPVLIDVTVSNPAAPSYNDQRPYEIVDAVARKREQDKIDKYRAFSLSHRILPFVVETTGRIGPMAREWMREVSKQQHHLRSAARNRIGAKVVQFVTLQMLMMGKSITFNSTSSATTPNVQALGMDI